MRSDNLIEAYTSYDTHKLLFANYYIQNITSFTNIKGILHSIIFPKKNVSCLIRSKASVKELLLLVCFTKRLMFVSNCENYEDKFECVSNTY